MKLKQLSRVDLPREKLEKYGTQKMQNYELLAILLGSGIQGVNVLELSRKVLQVIQKEGIQNISLDDLLDIKGLGKAKALQILSVIELGKRFTKNEQTEILSPKDIWLLCSDIKDSKKEHLVVFYLDTQNCLIERIIVSVGTLNASLVHPREVFEPALRLHASSIIIAHNHPSGEPKPSREDVLITERLRDSGKLLGIELQDHVIVATKGFCSLKGKNMF